MHHDSPDLRHCDIVLITFEFQKIDRRDVQVHMFWTDDDVLDPVKAWARTAQRIWMYGHTLDDTKVCAFQPQGGN